MPAKPLHIALYLNFLIQKGRSAAPVEEAVNVLSWVHQMAGVEDTSGHPMVQQVLAWAENENLRQFGSTYSHGTPFAPSNVYIKRKLRVWRAQKCITLVAAKTVLTSTGPQTTTFHAGKHSAFNILLN